MLYELHYVLEGQLDIHLPHEQTFHVQSGHFLIVPPQTMHSIIDAQPPSYKHRGYNVPWKPSKPVVVYGSPKPSDNSF